MVNAISKNMFIDFQTIKEFGAIFLYEDSNLNVQSFDHLHKVKMKRILNLYTLKINTNK